MNRREREYAESHSDHLLISSSGTTDTVIVHTNTNTRSHTHVQISNIKISRCASQKAFPSPSHIRCWAQRLDLKLLGAIQYGPGWTPTLGRFSNLPAAFQTRNGRSLRFFTGRRRQFLTWRPTMQPKILF